MEVNCDSSVMIGLRLHLTGGRYRKEKVFQNGHGRIAFSEHGGKTGMAMIKYPLCKKNAQHPKHCVYRSGCVLSISVID